MMRGVSPAPLALHFEADAAANWRRAIDWATAHHHFASIKRTAPRQPGDEVVGLCVVVATPNFVCAIVGAQLGE